MEENCDKMRERACLPLGTPALENKEKTVFSETPDLDFRRPKGTITYLRLDTLEDKIILQTILLYFTRMLALSSVVMTFYLYLFPSVVRKQMRARQNVNLVTTFRGQALDIIQSS